MITDSDLTERETRLRQALRDTYGVRGRTWERSLKRAGRLLPAHARKAGQTLVEARKLGGNPKLMVRYDPSDLAAAERTIMDHVDTVDVADRRKGKILGMLGVIVFNLIVIVTGFVIWLVATGHI